ncbi:MAG: rod shape-determining protein MreC [Smithellaceae bacterium]|nr:rod shape-determining protein MreC [Smithellaceae bacterium]
MLLTKKKLKLLVVVSLVSLSLSIFLYRIFRPFETSDLRKVIWEVVLPAEYLVKSSLSSLIDSWNRYVLLVGREDENQRLRKENVHLKDQLIGLTGQNREMQLETRRLHKLLGMNVPTNYAAITARVISRDKLPVSRNIVIDRGSEHGMKAGMPVVVEASLVGRITETSWNLSRVMLITDRLSRVDAVIQENRLPGILQGTSSADCILKYIPQNEEIKEGDAVFTSGLSVSFPKGLLLGRINRMGSHSNDLFREISVKPAVDLARLEEVTVLMPLAVSKK